MNNGSWGLAKKEYNFNSATKKRETQISMSQTQHKLKVQSQMMIEETRRDKIRNPLNQKHKLKIIRVKLCEYSDLFWKYFFLKMYMEHACTLIHMHAN